MKKLLKDFAVLFANSFDFVLQVCTGTSCSKGMQISIEKLLLNSDAEGTTFS